jgi:mono/diheme cytochrome c family protein
VIPTCLPRSPRRLLSGSLSAWLLAAGLATAVGCSDEAQQQPAQTPAAPSAPAPTNNPPAPPPQAQAPSADGAANAPAAAPAEDLAERGRRVYASNCIACHNMNPAIVGALGPEIAGSPRALVETRVLRAEYPPGYKPKRDTKLMIPLPHLANEIDALTAYLAKAKEAAR